jgi:poly(3-hydroxybutyrate) depolymerase
LLVVPAGDPGSKRALVLVFHGKGSNGRGMRDYVGAALEGAAAGQAVFVYPDGVDDGPGWPNVDGKDVAFVDALLAKLAGQLCYDRSRVFATGFSYGGFMSNNLGCARAGTIRGIASVSSGGPWGTCNGSAVAAWIAHGSSDGTVSLTSGQGSRDHWRAEDGCTQATHATSPPPCVAYEGCGANPVVWCQFDGGHEVPSFAPPAIWSFFNELR